MGIVVLFFLPQGGRHTMKSWRLIERMPLSQHCWLRARGNRQISDCQEKLWNSDDFALSNLPDKDPKDPLSEVLAVSRSVKTIRVQVNCLLSCVPGHFWWDSHNVQYKTEGYQQQHSLQCFIRGAWHGTRQVQAIHRRCLQTPGRIPGVLLKRTYT